MAVKPPETAPMPDANGRGLLGEPESPRVSRQAAQGVSVGLTVAEFAVHARLTTDAATNPPEPLLGLLTGILDACKAVIEDYAGDDTPQPVLDEATARMGSYLYEQPAYIRQPAHAFQHSGAQSLLSSWYAPHTVRVN